MSSKNITHFVPFMKPIQIQYPCGWVPVPAVPSSCREGPVLWERLPTPVPRQHSSEDALGWEVFT